MNNLQQHLAKRALDFLGSIPEECGAFEMEGYIQSFMGAQFDLRRIRVLVPETAKERIRVNLYAAYALICIFTHRYPDEVYGKEIAQAQNTLTRYKLAKQSYLSECTALSMPPQWKRLCARGAEQTEAGVRAAMTARFLALSDFKNYSIAEFLSDAAILKDAIYVSAYTPRKWAELIAKTREYSPVSPVFSQSTSLRRFELHSATYMGENHTKCDDCSGVVKIDADTWFAFCADGVGSAAHSHIGARLAGHCFLACLEGAYRRFGPEKLAFYIRHHLAGQAGTMWRKKLGGNFDQYACTFLFSFGCRAFIATGIVGDGNFLVEKKAHLGTRTVKGYLMLNDGISEGSKHGVMTLAHLSKNPNAMQIGFLDPSKIGGILMTSDGANGMFFEPMDGVLLPYHTHILNGARYFEKLCALSYDQAGQAVQMLCDQFSSANKFGGGRGDDCSVVYIKPKR